MLKYQIKLHHDKKLIYVEVEGKLDTITYKKVAEEVAANFNKYEYDIFYDLFNTKLDLDIKELSQAPRDIKGRNTSTAHKIHFAGYVNKNDYQDWKFIEITYIAIGYDTRVFLNKKEALKWLSECRPK